MKRQPRTALAAGGRDRGASFGFVNPPVVRGSTVLHDRVADLRERVRRRERGDDAPPRAYGIYGTPTHDALYAVLNELEGGFRSWAVPSGLTACTVPILAFVGAGDRVLIPDSVYAPTRRFCLEVLPRYGVQTTIYDPRAGAAIEALLTPDVRVLFVESPGSLTFEMQDIPALAAAAHRIGAFVVADNTWATPLYCQPLALGADVVVHAATKYIGGHSDLLLGTITANERAWPPLRALLHALGLTASPDDCWLALRGLRTLAARLQVHRANAERLIAWLRAQPEVERVLYPALPDDPGHALWQRDMQGASGLFGVALAPTVREEQVAALIDGLQLFGLGASWGGYESLIIPAQPQRTVVPLPWRGPLLRIHAGLEDADDLIADLQAGFERLRAA